MARRAAAAKKSLADVRTQQRDFLARHGRQKSALVFEQNHALLRGLARDFVVFRVGGFACGVGRRAFDKSGKINRAQQSPHFVGDDGFADLAAFAAAIKSGALKRPFGLPGINKSVLALAPSTVCSTPFQSVSTKP